MMANKNYLSLVFMGSADFAVPTLVSLIDAGHKIKCVYTQPPRPGGRGQRERRCPVHTYAALSEIDVRTPADFLGLAERADFASLDVDAAIVAAYGLLLPNAVIMAPKLGCFNVHASLLPRWRGAAPIQRAILAGDTFTGVTIMEVKEELDAGPIYASQEVKISRGMTAQSLHDQLAALGGPLMVKALAGIANGRLTPKPQSKHGVTYAQKLNKNEGQIDWKNRALDIERQVRGLNPWPGVWFNHNGERIKVLEAHSDAGCGQIGTVIKSPLYIGCSEGSLSIDRLQRPGKVPMDVRAYLHGNPIAIGSQLE